MAYVLVSLWVVHLFDVDWALKHNYLLPRLLVKSSYVRRQPWLARNSLARPSLLVIRYLPAKAHVHVEREKVSLSLGCRRSVSEASERRQAFAL